VEPNDVGIVMPGHSSLRRLRKLACGAGHPSLSPYSKQDVDGRVKPGHDGEGLKSNTAW
jgi:hypothetical protein